LPIWGGRTGYMVGIYGRVVTAFTGITGPVTIEVGFEGSTDAIIGKNDLGIERELIGRPVDAKWFCATRDTVYNLPSPIVTFTSASGNLASLTAGRVEIVVVHLVPETE